MFLMRSSSTSKRVEDFQSNETGRDVKLSKGEVVPGVLGKNKHILSMSNTSH